MLLAKGIITSITYKLALLYVITSFDHSHWRLQFLNALC